jgi:hypothetical protein
MRKMLTALSVTAFLVSGQAVAAKDKSVEAHKAAPPGQAVAAAAKGSGHMKPQTPADGYPPPGQAWQGPPPWKPTKPSPS